MSNEQGRCNGCGRRFSLSELRTGMCPWGCGSDDLEVEDEEGESRVHVGKRFSSDEDRMMRHKR